MSVRVGIQWGWRIPCAQAGCTKMHEVWASGQTPPCPWGENEDGWFHWRRRSGDYSLHTWIAYCPEHANEAKNWQSKRKAWYDARYEMLTSTYSNSAWQKFKDLFSVGVYQVWLEANPQPQPPWGGGV